METFIREMDTFMIRNAPDDSDLLKDFVEGSLEIAVTNIEVSKLSPRTALVTLEEPIDLQDAVDILKSCEEDLEDPSNPLEILDAGRCDDKLVVEELDEENLSLEFLKLYIHSTYADGEEVVEDVECVTGCSWVVLSLNDKSVVKSVLDKTDHKVLPSIDYHIHIKPYFSKFHSQSMNSLSVALTRYDQQAGTPNEMTGSGQMSSDNEEDASPPIERLQLSKLYWTLLEPKLKETTCQLQYLEIEETLLIEGPDAIVEKKEIFNLSSEIQKCSQQLSDEEFGFLKREKVYNMLMQYNSPNTIINVEAQSIIVHSLEDSKTKLQQILDRFLKVESIPRSKNVPDNTAKEVYNHCCQEYAVLCDLFSQPGKTVLKGLTEDVELAAYDTRNKYEEFNTVHKNFSLTDHKVLFVKTFRKECLENIFKDNVTEWKETKNNEKEILYEYECMKKDIQSVQGLLKKFQDDIKESDFPLNDFLKTEVLLINLNLRRDTKFINEFEKVYNCRVIVDQKETADLRCPSPAQRLETNPGPRATLATDKGILSVDMTTNCKIHIRPFKNIIREESDLLVCNADKSLNLTKTQVGKAFLKQDNNLDTEIKDCTFSPKGVGVIKRNLPGTDCKAFAFILLSKWQAGSSQDQGLLDAVVEVLDIANEMELKSVSFPPLGCGRAFRFPEKVVSQAVTKAIDTFKKQSKIIHLKEINFLAPSEELYNEYKKDLTAGDRSVAGVVKNNAENKGTKTGKDAPQTPVTNSFEQPKITIVHSRDQDISRFRNEIRKCWLYTDVLKLNTQYWPQNVLNGFHEEAKKLGVCLNRVEDKRTKECSFKMQGRPRDVDNLKTKIEEVNKSKNNILSPIAPPRGTNEFISFASNCTDTLPSYWTNTNTEQSFDLIDIDSTSSTYKAIEEAFTKSWVQDKVGLGNDAVNIPRDSKFEITKIQRIENTFLYKSYFNKRKNIFIDMKHRGRQCEDIAKLKGSKGPVISMEHLPEEMKKEIYHEINEIYLFHGTKYNLIPAICTHSMDDKVTSKSAMFGLGIYLAESSTKSDQYTDERDNRTRGAPLAMILSRVCMGDVYLCDHLHPSVADVKSVKLTRPPCMKCLKDRCDCGSEMYHSVMGDGKWIFREFVVYRKEQCYPEYLITYNRV